MKAIAYLKNLKERILYIQETNHLDKKEIKQIHQFAFGSEKGPVIANLALNLLEDKTAKPILSLGAFENEKMLGNVIFTKVDLSLTDQIVSAQILAPLAVLPDYQNKGIGQKLIQQGLKQLKSAGVDFVFVLGHSDYYPKSGFIKDAKFLGFEAPYPIPKEASDAWMVLALKPNLFGKIKGKVLCCEVLGKPEHWRE